MSVTAAAPETNLKQCFIVRCWLQQYEIIKNTKFLQILERIK